MLPADVFSTNDVIENDKLWRAAYEYYVHHRYYGFGTVVPVIVVLAVLSVVVNVLTYLFGEHSILETVPLGVTTVCAALIAVAMTGFWLHITHSAREFANYVSNSNDVRSILDIKNIFISGGF